LEIPERQARYDEFAERMSRHYASLRARGLERDWLDVNKAIDVDERDMSRSLEHLRDERMA
jgi:hypothetical protein